MLNTITNHHPKVQVHCPMEAGINACKGSSTNTDTETYAYTFRQKHASIQACLTDMHTNLHMAWTHAGIQAVAYTYTKI